MKLLTISLLALLGALHSASYAAEQEPKRPQVSAPENPLSCTACGNTYSVNRYFNRHTCKKNKSTTNKSQLRGRTVIYCEECNNSYRSDYFPKHKCKPQNNTPGELSSAQKQIQQEYCYTCAHCGDSYSSRSALVAHYGKKHPEVDDRTLNEVIQDLMRKLSPVTLDANDLPKLNNQPVTDPVLKAQLVTIEQGRLSATIQKALDGLGQSSDTLPVLDLTEDLP